MQRDKSRQTGRCCLFFLTFFLLPCRFYRLEKGNTAEQQERADLAAAQAHFGLLGWAAADLELAPGEASAPGCDALLAALLRRVVAVQEARQRGKAGPDWEALEWK